MGKRYDKIVQLNQTDFLVEFEMADNPTLFATRIGKKHNWLGIDLNVDVHIRIMVTFRGVSLECEEAHRIINETSKAPVKTPLPDEIKMDKNPERDVFIQGKEDAMLKVFKSMSKKIEWFVSTLR